MRSEAQIKEMQRKFDLVISDDTESDDPEYIIGEVLRWVLEENSPDSLLEDHLPI